LPYPKANNFGDNVLAKNAVKEGMRIAFSLTCLMALTQVCSSQQTTLSIAQTYFQEGKYELALSELGRPSSPDDMFLMADCFHKMEQFQEALEAYNEAESLGYAEESLLLHRGICRVSIADFERAETDLLTYFHANPEDEKAHYYLGVIDYMLYNNRESMFHLNRAIQINPDYMEAIYLKAANLAEMGKHEDSMEAFAKCDKLRPEFSITKLNMAVNYIEMKDYFNAETLLTQLINTDADCLAEALYYRGWIYYAQRQMSKACEDWFATTKLGHFEGTNSYTEVCENKSKTKRKQHTIVAF
jgi:tetratricopeptide (TPR) repeat protein